MLGLVCFLRHPQPPPPRHPKTPHTLKHFVGTEKLGAGGGLRRGERGVLRDGAPALASVYQCPTPLVASGREEVA